MKNTYVPAHETSDMKLKEKQYVTDKTFDWMIA
jgi:hypothetical protein